MLTDWESANGTVVNGQKVTRFVLHGGEVIMGGAHRAEVSAGGSVTLTAAEFRSVLAQWASGVSVVTSNDDGMLYGLTVSSFSSLSLIRRWCWCASRTPTGSSG